MGTTLWPVWPVSCSLVDGGLTAGEHGPGPQARLLRVTLFAWRPPRGSPEPCALPADTSKDGGHARRPRGCSAAGRAGVEPAGDASSDERGGPGACGWAPRLPPAASRLPPQWDCPPAQGLGSLSPDPPNRVETPTEPNEATVALRRQPRDRAAPQGGAWTPRPPRAPLHGGWLSPALLTCTSHPITGTEPHSDRNPNRQSRGPSRGSFPPVPNSSF